MARTTVYELLTVEAEYDLPTSELMETSRWTFEETTPAAAKAAVLSSMLPSDATLHRIGLWRGTPADRPTSGHETGILQPGTADEHHEYHRLTEY